MREISRGAGGGAIMATRFGSGRRWNSNIRGEIAGGEADVAIVGAGIVGLATAREIVLRFPQTKVVVVEKEADIVGHQTSHNRKPNCSLEFTPDAASDRHPSF
jgi:threonine dehydrogenase-like Zn-dependent dehydrogenase